ncbi:hypothetical protein LTR91_022387 [Friedmanniomyces endolithicus]|uniref:Mid2 domain-containing protein n=1 Tax=Friedmanniomyces endolithicus TaxID=329885 RepID=A0AAN6F5I1_9PEZI|nr:hypothetical protein LTR35_016859 [Friedmanniomyces endolithicus]KAK0273159.1 hypothetical protein LTS00_015913 [Friedmanniomyces endolithicus]KAK0305520.1 hypothetical protein LTR82_016751 [Friedmanniomyces endolithicus]KAK0926203.1 hypothetical protein LTR57_004454 [Friedmanniomyces endolithicus]KAK0956380.1 hypothetical protein LTR91_022387 [Friedmanniomyces endolithicus]
MAPTRGVGRFIAVAAIASAALQVNAQTSSSTQISATLTSSGQSTITPASSVNAASSSTDEPLALWSEARTLLSSYYPSTTLTQVASLTWPSAVVIGSSTYSVPPKSTGTPATSVLAESTTAATPVASSGMRSDEKLGVGIGVAVGAVALIVLGLIFCVLHKRRKASGTFFKRRPTPSVSDSDVEAWRSPMSRQTSSRSYGPSRDWMQQYNRMSEAPVAGVQPPPMAMHPAFVHQHSSRSTSEENPFFTPSESPDYSMTGAGAAAAGAGAHGYRNTDTPSTVSTLTPEPQQPRSTTPFTPAMMSTSWAQRMNDDPQHQNPYHNQYHHEEALHLPPPNHNPFASPEDEDEMDDIVSPIIPARSPERRHSPMVHYPSWSEVSSFDFAGEGAHGGVAGRNSRAARSELSGTEGSGSDGWRPTPLGRGDSMLAL